MLRTLERTIQLTHLSKHSKFYVCSMDVTLLENTARWTPCWSCSSLVCFGLVSFNSANRVDVLLLRSCKMKKKKLSSESKLYCIVSCCAEVLCCNMPCRACHDVQSVVLCRAVLCRAVQYSAVQCRAVLCRAVSCRALQCRAVPCSTVPCSAVPCSAVSGVEPCRAVPCLAVTCRAVLWLLLWCRFSGVVLCQVYVFLHLFSDDLVFQVSSLVRLSSYRLAPVFLLPSLSRACHGPIWFLPLFFQLL